MPNQNSRLIPAINSLDLSDEAKQKLVHLVRDPPPPENRRTIVDALKHRAIPSHRVEDNQVVEEKPLEKWLRLLWWALVYYPGSVIPYMSAVVWAGQTAREKAIEDLRKCGAHLREAIEAVGIQDVAYATFRQKLSVEGSVDGFRLTFSPIDMARSVIIQNHLRTGRSVVRQTSQISTDRIRVEAIEDPVVREFVRRDQEFCSSLQESGFVAHLTGSDAKQLLANNTPSGGNR